MNREELHAIAQVAAKNIKTPEDLNEFQQMLTQITVEAALNIELDEPLTLKKRAFLSSKIAVMAIRARRCKQN